MREERARSDKRFRSQAAFAARYQKTDVKAIANFSANFSALDLGRHGILVCQSADHRKRKFLSLKRLYQKNNPDHNRCDRNHCNQQHQQQWTDHRKEKQEKAE